MAYLTVTEAAERIKLSPSYLKKLRLAGGGPPYVPFGKRIVYTDTDLDEWMASRRVLSTSEAAA
jgi:excisionase family DNA binding protein